MHGPPSTHLTTPPLPPPPPTHTELTEAEQRAAAHVASLMARHEAAFRDMRTYYQQVTKANLDLIRELKVCGCVVV